jgi:hypothetical protein
MRTFCVSCAWCDANSRPGEGRVLRCRRLPPVNMTGTMKHGEWPLVYPSDWCGEWREGEPEQVALVEARYRD